MRRLLPLLLCVPLSRCGSAPPVETSFVFAVVPGLPADFANRASSPIGPAASLSALFEVADQLPGTEERPNFIIIAGVSREGVAETARDSAVTRAVATLRRSTIR